MFLLFGENTRLADRFTFRYKLVTIITASLMFKHDCSYIRGRFHFNDLVDIFCMTVYRRTSGAQSMLLHFDFLFLD